MLAKTKDLKLEVPKAKGFWSNVFKRFSKNKLALLSLLIIIILTLMCIFVPMLSSISYDKTNWSEILEMPNAKHLFGTDNLGRDLFVRAFIGGRITFAIAFAAAFVVLLIGIFYGAIAGYLGGKIDTIMMRIVDILYGIPFLFFCILLITLFGNSVALSFVAIAAISWLDMARIVRGQTLSIKHKEYVEAALVSGVSNRKIITRHVIPNLLGVVIVYAALTVPNMIVLSAVLSFFGLGVTEPMTSWGLLIADGAQNMESWWLLLFPAGLMTITLLSFAFVSNGLRDALDPR
ncbi:ABC transporter permease subunit [Aquella oligotrophica]|uniref:Oligopeptide transport system permease protein OppC n=1 Tax=Aquella oligotrophica TaxID=2067065 RepID=A0A2I7N7F5_9NEIS|nr:ABC transporter permease subunit [Aquella oligotrophica]AUR52388.1 peptide ABC transporter permease [Aquella oligotrophica]